MLLYQYLRAGMAIVVAVSWQCLVVTQLAILPKQHIHDQPESSVDLCRHLGDFQAAWELVQQF